MKIESRFIIAMLASALSVQADVIELKNGNVVNGKYAGGTPTTLRMDTAAGHQVVETTQAVSLTFTAPPPAAAAPAPAAGSGSNTLPAGTVLLVRMMDSISSKNAPGATFTTKLEYNLVFNGAVVIPGGTVIYGKVQSSTQARRALGKSTLDIRLSQVVLGGNPIQISSSGYQQAGQASIAKAAKGAAAGAAIGAIAGDAGMGAAIGATAGALIKGQTITIPPGTLLEFSLAQPVTLATGI